MDWLSWLVPSILSVAGAVGVAWLTTKATAKSQNKVVRIANDKEVSAARTAAEIAAADRQLVWFNELQEERNQVQESLKDLRKELEHVRAVWAAMATSYRRYINILRGQVFDLGGKPQDWPPDVDQ